MPELFRTGLAVALTAVIATPLMGQPARTMRIPPEGACPRCSISVVPHLTLGDASGPGGFESIALWGARDTRGRYYITAGQRTGIFVFDSAGTFLRKLGSAGRGPGEFTQAHTVWTGRGDSLYVADRVGLSTFGPEGAFTRSIRFEAVGFTQPRQDRGFVVAGRVPSPGSVGLPLHILNTRGQVERSFGSLPDPGPTGRVVPAGLHLYPGAGGRFWTFAPNAYEITEWDSNGRPTRILRRDPAWFPREAQYAEDEPAPYLRAVHEDRVGRLWVVVLVPGARWREGIGRRRPDGSLDIATRRLDLMNDTMLEVIDLNTGRLLASTRVAGYVKKFLTDSEVMMISSDEDDIPHAVIRKVRLIEP